MTAVCTPAWIPTFGPVTGVSDLAEALAVFDDGHGPQLYVGGRFLQAGATAAARIARWDGTKWNALGSGVQGDSSSEVFALAVFDDGSGPALYVGGRFSQAGGQSASNIARWDGMQWSPLGSGVANPVRSLAVFDDGSGPALYAGGDFVSAGGAAAQHIARWDGQQWTAVGGGIAGGVYALCIYDDGSGAVLVAGGGFQQAGGQPASCVARWDGNQWSALGSGLDAGVLSLAVYDDGLGARLFAGGYFTHSGSTAMQHVASFDGTSWSRLGSGTDNAVQALGVFDDGGGPFLCVGGQLNVAGGQSVHMAARWNGNTWSALGSSPETNGAVFAFASFDPGSGPQLFAAGQLWAPGPPMSNNVVRWYATDWGAPGSAGLDSGVTALCAFDDGAGESLYVAGGFTNAGGVDAPRLARWNGMTWQSLGSGIQLSPGAGWIGALTVFDDGTGPALFAGGRFNLVDGVPASSVARFRQGAWSALGTGIRLVNAPGIVSALCVHDDGSGPALYAAGTFDLAGGVQARNIAKWNGSSWSALGSGIDGIVECLQSHDDGAGAALYAGGSFWHAGGVSVVKLARWRQGAWSSPGTPIGGGSVESMGEYDDGTGVGLYVGGFFDTTMGAVGNSIVKLQGGIWSPLGSGLTGGGVFGDVSALHVADLGNGPVLYAAGWFLSAGGNLAQAIASWDGTQWSALGSGTTLNLRALERFDDGTGPALFVGGGFTSCPDSGDSFLAKWGLPAGCSITGSVQCEPGAGGVLACPCSNPPSGSGRGCDNSSATGGARLVASGSASLANDTLALSASGEPASALSIVLQSDVFRASGAVFGQGVSCLAGSMRRLYAKHASAGIVHAPGAGDPSVSSRSASLGDPIAQGTRRYYEIAYRDATVLGGCPATSTVDVSQALGVLWAP